MRDPRSSGKSLGRVQRAAAGVKVEQNIIEQRQLVVMRHGSVANGLVQLLEREEGAPVVEAAALLGIRVWPRATTAVGHLPIVT